MHPSRPLPLAALLLLTSLTSAWAAPLKAADRITPATEQAHRHQVVGARFVHLSTHTPQAGDQTLYGLGLLYEVELWPHGLELELTASGLIADAQWVAPLDVLLKKTFPLKTNLDAFVAGGTVFEIAHHHNHTALYRGYIASAGVYLWTDASMGLLMEVDYATVNEDGWIHEVETALGVAWRY